MNGARNGTHEATEKLTVSFIAPVVTSGAGVLLPIPGHGKAFVLVLLILIFVVPFAIVESLMLPELMDWISESVKTIFEVPESEEKHLHSRKWQGEVDSGRPRIHYSALSGFQLQDDDCHC